MTKCEKAKTGPSLSRVWREREEIERQRESEEKNNDG